MIRDIEGTMSDVDFAAKLTKEFTDDTEHPRADAGISVLPTPLVCQADTQLAKKALDDFIKELETNLTFEDWLWKAT